MKNSLKPELLNGVVLKFVALCNEGSTVMAFDIMSVPKKRLLDRVVLNRIDSIKKIHANFYGIESMLVGCVAIEIQARLF